MEGKRWNAYISHFKSLKDFYVYNKKDKPIVQEISVSLQQLDSEFLTLVSLKPGDLVAAKHTNDGLWYRATVLDLKKNTCTVHFIDNGKNEMTSQIKRLPEKLCNFHPMAYHCMLDDVDNEEHTITTNSDIFYVVLEFMTSIEVTLKFLNNAEPYAVKMKWDDRNIKIFLDNIISYGITFETYKTLKINDQSDSKMEVNLIHTESINEFYVETEDADEIKKKIEHELIYGTIWEPLTDYKFGKVAIAKSTADNRWYRVRILKINDKSNCSCYLIDYGLKVECVEFYEATGYLKSAPPVIKRCSLYMPNIKKKKMLFDILSQCFIDEMYVCKDQKIIMSIVKTGEPNVVELFVDNFNVATVIEPKPVIVFHVFHVNALTLQIDSAKRRAVVNELINTKTLQPVKTPQIGNLYGALYQGGWYRAYFKQMNGKLFEVNLVDNGNSNLSAEKLYILPEHMKNVKYLSIHGSLGLNDQHYSSFKLRNLCSNNNKFTMFVLKHNPNATDGHYIHLLVNNIDVKSLIKKDKNE